MAIDKEKDKYRAFNDRVSGEVHKASLSASVTIGDKVQRIRLRNSALPSMIPPGATIEIEPIVFHKARFGAVVYVKLENDLALRRFLRVEVIREMDFIVVVREKAKRVERLPANSLVGRIIAAEFQGKPVRLSHGGNLFDWMTDFGTTTPIHKIKALLRNWKGDKPPVVADPNKKKKTARGAPSK